jgi:hypothetical protein
MYKRFKTKTLALKAIAALGEVIGPEESSEWRADSDLEDRLVRERAPLTEHALSTFILPKRSARTGNPVEQEADRKEFTLYLDFNKIEEITLDGGQEICKVRS